MDYVIASTPRVGSNLLASLLMGTRRLGEPREALCPSEFGDYALRIPRETGAFDAYFEERRVRESTHGVFGMKVHFAQLVQAVEFGFDVDRFFPRRVVYLTRADVVGQAISYVRALQTGAWISKKAERARPVFDAASIRSMVRRLVDENHAWERLFRDSDIEPYRIGYEALCADFGGELRGLLPFLEVDPADVDVDAIVERALAYFQKQRDGLSEEWRERYGAWLAAYAQPAAA